jgi:hypothetical protein
MLSFYRNLALARGAKRASPVDWRKKGGAPMLCPRVPSKERGEGVSLRIRSDRLSVAA